MSLYDVVIVGSGPSGMTAAIYAAKSKYESPFIRQACSGRTDY